MVVFAAKLEIAQHDADLTAGDPQNDEDQQQETKDIVIVVEPNRAQNEKELNEACSKRKYTRHQSAKYWVHIPDLCGYLSWNLVCSDWLFVSLIAESKKIANVN